MAFPSSIRNSTPLCLTVSHYLTGRQILKPKKDTSFTPVIVSDVGQSRAAIGHMSLRYGNGLTNQASNDSVYCSVANLSNIKDMQPTRSEEPLRFFSFSSEKARRVQTLLFRMRARVLPSGTWSPKTRLRSRLKDERVRCIAVGRLQAPALFTCKRPRQVVLEVVQVFVMIVVTRLKNHL